MSVLKQIFVSKLTESRSTDVDGVGSMRIEDGKIYRFVQNKETTVTLEKGNACVHDLSDAVDMDKKVQSPVTADLSCLAGVVVATDGIPPLHYGWVQCYGANDDVDVFASQTTAKAAGISLKAVNAVTYLDTDTAVGTATTLRRSVQLLEAVATVTTGAATSAACFIHCI